MRQWRVGLKVKFIGMILILLFLVFSAIAAILLRSNTATLRDNLYARSTAFAALATDPIGNAYLNYHDSGTVLINQQISSFRKLDSNITNIAIVDTAGNLQFSQGKQFTPVSAANAQTFDPKNIHDANGVISRIIYPFIETDGKHRYAIVYDIASSSINGAVANLTKTIIFNSLLGMLLSAIIMYIAINVLFLRPIKTLRDQAMIISSGYYKEQISQSRNDEIGDLANSVSHMAESLKADIVQLKEIDVMKTEFMRIISHNLLTPLTIIEGYTAMARDMAKTDEMKEIIANIDIGGKRLNTLANNMLVITSIEAGTKIFHAEPFQLGPLLDSIGKDFSLLAEEKKITFTVDVAVAQAKIMGSRVHLRGAIWNVLENALKFTDAGGLVSLKAIQDDNGVSISIRDTGIGIEPAEVKKLFTKFHRGTSTLTYNYDGTGVGLYITKLIVQEHDGTISVESTPEKGSTFTISLPTIAA